MECPALIYIKNSFVKLREVGNYLQCKAKNICENAFQSSQYIGNRKKSALFTDVPFVDPDGSNGGLAEPAYRNIGVNINLKF